ncbi:hypothetical protein FHG87_015878 [Trinorchestia longiramus]|nr:hypothetical protein FHG87_015878 [Trinorchestia longiramus]
MHSQSGLCSPTKQSQPCIGNAAWDTKTWSGDASSCSLDYLSGEECSTADWPIFAYDAQLPPFRLTVYRHHTWMMDPAVALNLSLATDVPTGVKFFFEHQHDPQRRLCRKFSIVNPDGYFLEEYDEDNFYSLLDDLPGDPTLLPQEVLPAESQNAQTAMAVLKELKKTGVSLDENLSSSVNNSNRIDDVLPSSFFNSSVDATNVSLSGTDVSSIESSAENVSNTLDPLNEVSNNFSKTLKTVNTSVSNESLLLAEDEPVPPTLISNISRSSSNSTESSRQKRDALPLPPVLFWDCPMFADGLEGQDFFLRLSDDAGWGAHLSFTVPTIDRHDHVSTPVSEWWVFHYVHLEHVTLESSIPVTLQAAPFARLMYNVSLRSVCCDHQDEPQDAADGSSVASLVRDSVEKIAGPKVVSVESSRRSGQTSREGCTLCGDALASIILTGMDDPEQPVPARGTLLSAELPYQAVVGQYAVTVQVLSSECPTEGCFVAVSPVFAVSGSSYGDFVLVVAVILLVMFLLSFVIMALVIRSQAGKLYSQAGKHHSQAGKLYSQAGKLHSQAEVANMSSIELILRLTVACVAEVASKKLWCRPRVLLVCSPHSPSSLSLITTLTSFLHHSAAISITTIHNHLADADPYLWMQYEMRTANKVLFLVPPKGQTVARCSPVQQQWRLGVLCYAASHGALASSGGQDGTSTPSRGCCRRTRPPLAGQRDKDKFALLTTSCSGPVPAEISHLQRFWLLEDIVYLVTWIHDGNFLDRWFLWSPLMRRSENRTSSAGTPYKRRPKKNSFMWSGCRRDRDLGGPSSGGNEIKGESDVEAQSGCNGGLMNHENDNGCMRKNDVQIKSKYGETGAGRQGEGSQKTLRKSELNEEVGAEGSRQSDTNGTSAAQSMAPNIEFSTAGRPGTARSQSMDSSSLNSSLCLRIEESVAGNVSHERSLSNRATGQERPDWVDDVLNNTEANTEERINLPVTQYPCAPSLVHLKEAARLVEKEQAKLLKIRSSKVVQASKVVKPSSSSKSWLQSLFFKKKSQHSSSKPILEDTEELSLYDNSLASNSGMSKLHDETQQWQGGECMHHSNNLTSPESPSKLSANTLCDLSNEDVFSVSYDGVRLAPNARDLTDPSSYDGMPSVSELPLLGEAIMSPTTETSYCQVEEDDDDFTAMLFGGTVSDASFEFTLQVTAAESATMSGESATVAAGSATAAARLRYEFSLSRRKQCLRYPLTLQVQHDEFISRMFHNALFEWIAACCACAVELQQMVSQAKRVHLHFNLSHERTSDQANASEWTVRTPAPVEELQWRINATGVNQSALSGGGSLNSSHTRSFSGRSSTRIKITYSEDIAPKVDRPKQECVNATDCETYNMGVPAVCDGFNCVCPDDFCWHYQYLFDLSKVVYFCDTCGSLGSTCLRMQDCDSPGECGSDRFCHCPQGENSYGMCFMIETAYEHNLLTSALGVVAATLYLILCIIAFRPEGGFFNLRCCRRLPWYAPSARAVERSYAAIRQARRGRGLKSPAFTHTERLRDLQLLEAD